jgi:hypothetical protein
VPAPYAPTDAANLAGLLRRESELCTTCIAEKLVLSLGRVIDAVAELGKTVILVQELRRCPRCEQTRWVVSLKRPQ